MKNKAILTANGTILMSEVTISSIEYANLIAKAERIATLERLLKHSQYISIEEIQAVLCIKGKKGDAENG